GGQYRNGRAIRMSTFIYPTDPHIIAELAACMRSIPAADAAGQPRPSPPTLAQLAELLNSAFAASLETEEGRVIAFTVDFFDDPNYPFPYRMKRALPLAPRDLAGLAVALDPLRSRICVAPGPGGLRIAGLVHLGDQHAFHGKRQTPHQLSICVLGPGILLVRY